MFDIHKPLTDNQIFYSCQTMSFYMAFSAGLGMDDIRELPTSVNMHLHQTIDIIGLASKTSDAFCVGRYQDNNEIDEANFEFEGYDIELSAVGFEHYRAKPMSFVAPSLLRLNKALMLASRAHKYQRRKYDNSPYLNHLLEVQDLLINTAQVRDEDIIIGGLLHDVIEDTDVTKTDLLNEFGSRVCNIVDALTDDKDKSLEERRHAALAKIPVAPKSIKLIKLADITSNAAAIPDAWCQLRIKEYYQWLDKIAYGCKDVSKALYCTYKSSKIDFDLRK